MPEQTAAEHELAQLMVRCLNLEDLPAEQIDPDAALFGSGLGLDSIDALELALAVSQTYGLQLPSDEEGKRVFASLRALAAHIQHRLAAAA